MEYRAAEIAENVRDALDVPIRTTAKIVYRGFMTQVGYSRRRTTGTHGEVTMEERKRDRVQKQIEVEE
ncbi:hypothetical protein SODALDRAFT_355458 [Sodiomyces alkalinus F11]|uniref:Uncharacterized protein n=1 Tax=Sodiomyces alkalinus (strain CBS 110278 / VKM F-3762 / F11) TaxID=1314773 RepID=A0A3N2Q911_SODAK|nr:hypothetical protein SODALDRAFT_355458 [Sodiomyces alkalinus F11]ROT43254.1 hypothetical protein SODALDRAFT_355458 [Sodiomyces alkalinus F11]